MVTTEEDAVSALVMQGKDPRTGEVVGDPLTETTPEELDAVLDAAARTASMLRATSPGERAAWLRAVAAAVDAAAPELVSLAEAETGLPRPRLTGEVTRTTNQLELFARVLEEGSFLEATIDHADPAAGPPYPDLRRVLEPLGTVLVFTASNFPFAFSVAGGDTASALAAGCPVIVKSHPGHPGLSVRTGQIVADALAGAGAPGGSFAVVHGVDTGVAAITDRRVRACSFTGSLAGGRALHELAAGRPDPIPFYGELGSLNPVLVTQAAVARRGDEIAKDYVASFTLGTGQFCTKPGLLLLPRGHGLEAALTDAADAVPPAPMLGSRIHQSFVTGVEALAGRTDIRPLRAPSVVDRPGSWAGAALFATTAAQVLAAPEQPLEECFGPVSLVVEYDSLEQAVGIVRGLGGSLTATLHAEEEGEEEDLTETVAALTDVAGRLVWNGWPTGVAVGWATHHGGPWPATTDPLHTSVGASALRRFLKPAAYQSVPDRLLPAALQDDNPLRLPRRVDGVLVPGKPK
jgi:NADP-dependent aldehyde dehydrogenase